LRKEGIKEEWVRSTLYYKTKLEKAMRYFKGTLNTNSSKRIINQMSKFLNWI
jgi:hypothetical protein